MSLMVNTTSAGIAQIQRLTFIMLFQTVNLAIDKVNDAWRASDVDFAAMTGREHVEADVLHVPNENFHEGHRPSLITAPMTSFPNVAIQYFRAVPQETGFDHQVEYRVNAVLEAMVHATMDEGEEVCNRRAHRMNEAINACLAANKNLGGTVSGFATEPTSGVTELFTRKDRGESSSRSRTAYGEEFLWQGVRIEYAVKKEAARFTSPGVTAFQGAETHNNLAIDQA